MSERRSISLRILALFNPRSLSVRLSILVTVLLALLTGLLGALSVDLVAGVLEEQIKERALQTARAYADHPLVRQALSDGERSEIQRLSERIRAVVGADFVVVGDARGIRLSHPDPKKIGLPFVGGDHLRALSEGETYASHAVGTLGPSLRGFAPVKGGDGSVLGFVATGFLLSDIEEAIAVHRQHILGYVAIVFFFGHVGALWIARRFKAAIFGLEPREIAALFREREAIIGALHEGILAVDGDGRVTLANLAAREHLGLPKSSEVRGRLVDEICRCPESTGLLTGGKALSDCEVTTGGRSMIFNVVPIPAGGAVASFRPKGEIDRLARELSQVQEHSELLRAQAHEHSNKLHTIAGLIQIGATGEALELILSEASGQRALIETLGEAVPDPILAGIILGKFSRAQELQIDFSLDPDSSLTDVPESLDRERLITVIGNLLDNAFEAVRKVPEGRCAVRLLLTDLGRDLIFEVDDSGPGIDETLGESVFRRGVSGHDQPGRGMGLYLARKAAESLGGEITFSRGELGGALFTAIIPKERSTEE